MEEEEKEEKKKKKKKKKEKEKKRGKKAQANVVAIADASKSKRTLRNNENQCLMMEEDHIQNKNVHEPTGLVHNRNDLEIPKLKDRVSTSLEPLILNETTARGNVNGLVQTEPSVSLGKRSRGSENGVGRQCDGLPAKDVSSFLSKSEPEALVRENEGEKKAYDTTEEGKANVDDDDATYVKEERSEKVINDESTHRRKRKKGANAAETQTQTQSSLKQNEFQHNGVTLSEFYASIVKNDLPSLCYDDVLQFLDGMEKEVREKVEEWEGNRTNGSDVSRETPEDDHARVCIYVSKTRLKAHIIASLAEKLLSQKLRKPVKNTIGLAKALPFHVREEACASEKSALEDIRPYVLPKVESVNLAGPGNAAKTVVVSEPVQKPGVLLEVKLLREPVGDPVGKPVQVPVSDENVAWSSENASPQPNLNTTGRKRKGQQFFITPRRIRPRDVE